ncbi:O-antigen ligase family protein [Pacificimonas flava]|uniref:Binding-protein-dependent transport system protein n=1 Tax=Pacificimonas flava TaxID=1234595 RepID=M2T5B7_9SPHN|nr:O-antigen ligase family protein [Pacificimonas flava]EMD81684.1 binding-protein-dependent transport system protein [Pacificimonas flava]MBB5281778.1 O-antigen ligase [Pacificimonas flava]
MFDHSTVTRRSQSRIPFFMMFAVLILFWLSGGASRGDVGGQVVVQVTTWMFLAAFALFCQPPEWRSLLPVGAFLLTVIAVLVLQLVPLPPELWTALPGRYVITDAAMIAGREQPWRPLSISPGGTLNALSSLAVPILVLLLLAALGPRNHWRIAVLLLALIAAAAFLGLLQFSGGNFDHPLVNDSPGSVSAIFANRNHFALFVAIGCLLAPAWAFRDEKRQRWKGPVAIALLLLFVLIILATGSRTGMLVGLLGVGLGLLNVRRPAAAELRRLPKIVSVGIMTGGAAILVAAVVLSVTLGRARSVDRAFTLEIADDLRRQALPTVLDMTTSYFPFGSGFGTFDPVYRMHEPEHLLGLSYFNHAHNDFLEVLLEGGVAGLLLVIVTIGWWLWKSVGVWRSGSSAGLLPRLGSAILLLIFVASATDYPARTPLIMAIVTMAAVWLSGLPRPARSGEDAGRTVLRR